MRQQVKKTKDNLQGEEPNQHHPLVQCAEIILPWLNPQELANVSLTCKTLAQISRLITLRRSLDATRSLESHPIPFHNSLDHPQPPYAYFLYTPSQLLVLESPSRQPWGSLFFPDSRSRLGYDSLNRVDESRENVDGCGCDCDGCREQGGGSSGCEVLGLEELEMEIMNECGPSCGCGLECRNRLTQRGISVKLKIVRHERKGWGLYADQMISQGQFVCEYAGELLTTEEARRRQKVYDELSSCGQLSSALLVVREHLPSGKACLRINIDATRIGNAARFINHSCDGGNLFTILIRGSGALMPRLCFFASRDIKEDEELSFSYGEIRVRSKGLQCFCGSSCCFGTLPSEHT